jgi:hypothetical protein
MWEAEASGELEPVGGGFVANFGRPSEVMASCTGIAILVLAIMEAEADLPLAAADGVAVAPPDTILIA